MNDMQSKLGICQWFHYRDYASVERAVELLRELGVRHLRTGVSWADFVRPHGQEWYDWQMEQLAEFDVLLSVWHTPPSISEGNACSSPPRRLQDYADFIDLLINRYGDQFGALELWNEPNNRYKWNFEQHDPQWAKFGAMIGMAAYHARSLGRTTVLGGMAPVDPAWLELIGSYGALPYLDVIAIHGFPEMWWNDQPNWEWHSHWSGWEHKLTQVAPVADGRPIWITETGLATIELQSNTPGRYRLQSDLLEQAASAPVDRVYWYSLIDLDPGREAIEGFHVDENEYHMGLVAWDATRKEAWYRLRDLLTTPQNQVVDRRA